MSLGVVAVVGDSVRFIRRNLGYLSAVAAPYFLAASWLNAGDDGTPRVILIVPFILNAWLALPLAVNTHRAVLDGPRPLPLPLKTLLRVGSAEMRFLLVMLLTSLVFLPAAAIAATGAAFGGGSGVVIVTVGSAAAALWGLYAALRLQPAFAAAALGLRAPWRIGWVLSRGHALGILATFLLAAVVGFLLLLPVGILVMAVAMTTAGSAGMADPSAAPLLTILALSLLGGAAQTFSTVFTYVVTAHLFLRLHDAGAGTPAEAGLSADRPHG